MHRNVFAFIAVAAAIATPSLARGDEKHHEHSKPPQTAFGRPADPATAHRTIAVEMRDSYEFSPSEITVKVGEIVRFVAVNAGIETHEMVLGTMQDLRDHYEMMKQHRGMHHDEPHIA